MTWAPETLWESDSTFPRLSFNKTKQTERDVLKSFFCLCFVCLLFFSFSLSDRERERKKIQKKGTENGLVLFSFNGSGFVLLF